MTDGKKIKKLWDLYENAVQDPSYTVDVVDELYSRVFRKSPKQLREDFCGTFAVGREWIKRGRGRRALGLDISEPVAKEAVRRNGALLTPAEQKRAAIHCRDVRSVTKTKADVVLAENFSFFVFKERNELLQYFKACHRSLDKKGIVILDVIGGPEFTEAPRVYREMRDAPTRSGRMRQKYSHTWCQRRYDPSTAFGLYSIGFEVGGKKIRHAFTYDWRVWTVPEIRDCLRDAGFDEVKVFLDEEMAKLTINEVSSLPNTFETWLCLVVGIKRK